VKRKTTRIESRDGEQGKEKRERLSCADEMKRKLCQGHQRKLKPIGSYSSAQEKEERKFSVRGKKKRGEREGDRGERGLSYQRGGGTKLPHH